MRRFARRARGLAVVTGAVVALSAGSAHAAATLNCPRAASFWARELGVGDLGATAFTPRQTDAIAQWISDRPAWSGWASALTALGATGDPEWRATPRDRARVQYAVLLANLAAGALRIETSFGEPVALDPATVVAWEGRPVTLEALAGELGGRLERNGADGSFDAVAAALERINAGAGIGPTCESPGGTPAPGARDVALGRAFPNPFNATTSLSYTVPSGGAYVEIGVYDVGGRIVRMLADGPASSGRYDIEWDGTTRHGALARPGAYFIRGTVGEQRIASRVMYVQ